MGQQLAFISYWQYFYCSDIDALILYLYKLSSPYGTFQGAVTFKSQFNLNIVLNPDLIDTKRQKFKILMK